MREDLTQRYFRWIMRSLNLCGADSGYAAVMFETPFEVLVERDINRAEDGENLRYRFGETCGIPDARIASELDSLPCSVLEMLAALSLRAGEQVFGSPYVKEGAQWIFSEIARNMGLTYSPLSRLNDILRKLNCREYGRDGRGGPFYIPFTRLGDENRLNMRESELWYQMMAYINKNYSRFADLYLAKSTV